jgi:hypothetical protein
LKYLAEICLFFSKFFVFLRIFVREIFFSQNKFKEYLNFQSEFSAVETIFSKISSRFAKKSASKIFIVHHIL